MPISHVVLYARVSKNQVAAKYNDKVQDTENQLAQLREFCAKQGWTITREYVDHVSGKTAHKRTQFQAMLAAASRREFDLILFWSLDRFSREGVLPTLKHLEVITSYGVAWKSFTEQYFDSCGIFRDAIISIAATLAKQERVRISERTIAGLERARRQGRFGGRPHRVVDREWMRRLREEGRSFREIATEVGVSAMTAARILRSA
ncbi:MAG TPA: recombinase family protein [Ktedonobacteraceae bacterium]|nr:recombinase family protein [Ktedonobacteraceae bacterium]